MAMDSIEQFGEFEEIDPWRPTSQSVALKHGLDISELTSNDGTEIEIDTKALESDPAFRATGGRGCAEQEDVQYDKSEVYKQVCLEPLIGSRGESSGSESDDGQTPFENLARKMTDLTGNAGVLKKIIRQGEGRVVPEGSIVRVHYNGYLEYSGEPYDSSRLRNSPMQFTLGKEQVIPGWEVGIGTMRKNELARFLVKPEYAFGDLGCPPRIPPEATILFEIELLSFVDYRAADEFTAFSREERENATLDQIIAVANAEKDAGNDFFQRGNYGKAASKYSRAVRLLEERRLKDAEEEIKWKAVLLKLYLNQSLCSLRQGKPKLAITQCRRVMELEPKNVKAHFRLGQASMKLGDFKKSRDYLTRACRLAPGNQEIRLELQKLDRTVKKFRDMEKDTCRRMFGQGGGSLKSSNSSGKATSSKGENGDYISPAELVKIRSLYVERFSAMKETWDEAEFVLQPPLSQKEIQCAEQVARELELLVEKISNGGLRIYKEAPKEVAEHLNRP